MNTCCRKKIRLNNHLPGLLLLLILISCTRGRDQNSGESDFQIYRGINISHWLSQNPDSNAIPENFFNEDDVRQIADFGFDHLRLPVDEEHLWNRSGEKRHDAFQSLHKAMKWCQEYKLNVVLDLHEIRSHSFNQENNLLWNSKEAQQHFIKLWIQLSEEFSDYPVDFLAYELLNEAVADNPDDWNRLLSITIDSIRKFEPLRKIIIGSNRWQSPDTFDELVIPDNDSNIILSFHFYTPFIFTHYRTHWTDIGKYSGAVQYPGQVIKSEYIMNYDSILARELEKYTNIYAKDTMLKYILEPIEYAKAHRLMLYCGEFGCTPNVHRADRLQWYKDVSELFNENDIAWANWDYKGAFSIYNQQTGMPDKKLIEILTGQISK